MFARKNTEETLHSARSLLALPMEANRVRLINPAAALAQSAQ
jgi:hypothetical protein